MLLGIGNKETKMDKEWLEKVETAKKVYEEMYAHQAAAVNTFVRWLYQVYGIVPPNDKDADNGSN
jgi:hypothetical protein